MKSLILVLSLAALGQAAVLHNGVVVPTYAQVCRRSDPELDACLRDSLKTLIKSISRDGIRQLHVPPLDPWRVKEIVFNYGITEGFKVSSRFTDMKVYGFSRVQINDAHTDFDHFDNVLLELDVAFKKVFIEGDFIVEALVDKKPVFSKGTYNVTVNDAKGPFRVKGHMIKKNGVDFLMVDSSSFYPTIGDFKLRMDTGEMNALLGNLFASFMNTSWRSVYAESRPFIEAAFNQVITPSINAASLKIPFDQLIPQ